MNTARSSSCSLHFINFETDDHASGGDQGKMVLGLHNTRSNDLTGYGDSILVNGIFNLNPKRKEVFLEIARVLKSGGKVYSAEMVFTEQVKTKKTCSLDDWFAWISGAKESGAFLDEFKKVGFSDVRILRTSKNARTNHKKLVAADVVAVKR